MPIVNAYPDPLLFGLPSRVLTALLKDDVTRIEELAGYDPVDLRQIDQIGPTSVKRIREHLRTYDLALGTELPEAPLYYGDQKNVLKRAAGSYHFYHSRKWWRQEGVELFQKCTAKEGWINGEAFECTMETGSDTLSVSAREKGRKLHCSCGSSNCNKHVLAGFLLMVEAERSRELFGKSTIEEMESAPVYQPLSHDPLFYLLDSTIRSRLLKQDVKWVEELAEMSESDLEDISGIGQKRARRLTEFLEEFDLRPGVPPESIDLPPGKRFPQDLGQLLLDLRRKGLNPDRGVQYARDGRVLQLNERTEQRLEAEVQGRERYDVRMDLDEEEYNCTCPVPDYRGPCKHIFATALTLARRKRVEILSTGGQQDLSKELTWLKRYLNSNEDESMFESEMKRSTQDVFFYLYESNGRWHVQATDDEPDLMEGKISRGTGGPGGSVFSSTSGMAPKDAVLIRHLNTNYYDVRPGKREGILGEILPMMSDRRLYIEMPDGTFHRAEVTDERVEPGLAVTCSEADELRVEPYIEREDERIMAERFDLVCPNPMWFRVEHRLYRSTAHFPLLDDLLSRIDGDALSVAGEERTVFLEDLFPDLMDRDIPIQLPDNRLEEEQLDPQPRVYLAESGDRLITRLKFAYGDLEFTRISEGRFPVPDPDPDRNRLINVERDPERERAIREELLDTGLVPATERNENKLTPDSDRTRWLVEELPDLSVKGFEVYGKEDIDRPDVVEDVSESRVTITGGIDWFELEGGVEFESGSVSFSELMDRVEDGETYVQLSENEYGRIPDRWIRRFANLNELAETDHDKIQVPGLTFRELDGLLEEADETESGETVRKYRRFYREFDGMEDVRESGRFQGTLRDYQRAGLAWLQFLREYGFGGLLADDMGLGKTIQVLAHLQLVREDLGRMPDTLVVAPRSVLRNWEKEANRFLPDPPVYRHHGQDRREKEDGWPGGHLSITTYGTMRSDVEWLKEIEFDTVVLDECQAIRNPDTKRAKTSRLLSAENRLGLSGTPVQNTVLDLWSQFQFLNPGLLGSRSYFEQRFVRPIETDRNQERSNRLQNLIHPFLLRRTKEQVEQDLPDLSRSVIDCPMPGDQEELYESCRRHFRDVVRESMDEQGVHKSRFKVLEGLTRLRQICCHTSLVNGELGNDEVPDASSKLERFVELVREVIDEGHRALVFSQFVQFLEVVRETVEEEGWSYEYLDGSTRDREERVRRFQSDDSIPLFLISLKAGGEGLNLTGADYVFLMDPWWNPAVEQQAMDRTHRIGQDQPVMVYRLICPGTIEEKMMSLQERKQEVAEDIVTPDADFFKDMDREDLLDLFS